MSKKPKSRVARSKKSVRKSIAAQDAINIRGWREAERAARAQTLDDLRFQVPILFSVLQMRMLDMGFTDAGHREKIIDSFRQRYPELLERDERLFYAVLLSDLAARLDWWMAWTPEMDLLSIEWNQIIRDSKLAPALLRLREQTRPLPFNLVMKAVVNCWDQYEIKEQELAQQMLAATMPDMSKLSPGFIFQDNAIPEALTGEAGKR